MKFDVRRFPDHETLKAIINGQGGDVVSVAVIDPETRLEFEARIRGRRFRRRGTKFEVVGETTLDGKTARALFRCDTAKNWGELLIASPPPLSVADESKLALE